MPRKFSVLFLMILILIGSAAFGEWWDDKSYIEWSEEQVDKILNDSPWVGLSLAGRRQMKNNAGSSIPVPVFCRTRLLAARPVREALLRQISLNQGITVDLKDLKKGSEAKERRSRLEKFIESNPNNWLVKGDDKYIIVALTLRIGTQNINLYGLRDQVWLDESNSDEFFNVDFSKLIAHTSLKTDTGKRLAISDFIPPGPDGLGAKILFRRHLPDGSPFVAAVDHELMFETRINEMQIKYKFDLSKMRYMGELEI